MDEKYTHELRLIPIHNTLRVEAVDTIPLLQVSKKKKKRSIFVVLYTKRL